MDDPDAPIGTFTHWVLFNIPPDSQELPEAISAQEQLPNGAPQGKNGFGRIGYAGPCPPLGSPHRYQFTPYALNSTLDLNVGISKKQLLEIIQEHVLAQRLLKGIHKR
jgi:Raf kinase inhibitor-like YbhB/YbcL family protein